MNWCTCRAADVNRGQHADVLNQNSPPCGVVEWDCTMGTGDSEVTTERFVPHVRGLHTFNNLHEYWPRNSLKRSTGLRETRRSIFLCFVNAIAICSQRKVRTGKAPHHVGLYSDSVRMLGRVIYCTVAPDHSLDSGAGSIATARSSPQSPPAPGLFELLICPLDAI